MFDKRSEDNGQPSPGFSGGSDFTELSPSRSEKKVEDDDEDNDFLLMLAVLMCCNSGG